MMVQEMQPRVYICIECVDLSPSEVVPELLPVALGRRFSAPTYLR